jgi:Alpha/beta hydrolase of unknown function (DUF900)
MNAPLLFIERFRSDDLPFPAYLVASTAPINIEDQNINLQDPSINPVQNFSNLINEISEYLKKHGNDAEILIVIHGYNNSYSNVRTWFSSICKHFTHRHSRSRSPGFLLIGYRWPSEKVSPKLPEDLKASGSLQEKCQWAKESLPFVLDKLSTSGKIGLIASAVAGVIVIKSFQLTFLMVVIAILIISLFAVLPIWTILGLRLVGYFRDSYRATNFGVSDLVELIRQIDNALVQSSSEEELADKKSSWQNNRIKLSFIGHSMGAFVVTNTVRILSDVFDRSSIGSIDASSPDKDPSGNIGNVFSLGRLVLVAPDIPAETIISGRANFLQSSLRRFDEAYLFSNEGDMALRLASTAANYFSYPSRTQAGGYRLGNVCISNSMPPPSEQPIRPERYGMTIYKPSDQLFDLQDGNEEKMDGFPLDYLYLQAKTRLSYRQKKIALAPEQEPIGERFTFFDCTDYTELEKGKPIGLLSHAMKKQSLNVLDYALLSIAYFRGKIDTHGGYFSDGSSSQANPKPEAAFTKMAIYGLASLGFEKFLEELPSEPIFENYQEIFGRRLQELETSQLTTQQQQKIALSHILSSICRDKGIQVLLARDRYTKDIMG